MEEKDWQRVDRLRTVMGDGDFILDFIKALPTDIVLANLEYLEMNQGLDRIEDEE